MDFDAALASRADLHGTPLRGRWLNDLAQETHMFPHLHRPGRGAGPLAAALCLLALVALPATAQQGSQTQRAQTLPHPSTDGKVLGSMKKGTDAAGRGMDRAGTATLNGVNRASESASRPIRNFGEWLGGKLPQGPARPAGDPASSGTGS